jgi:hypothetical protein
LFSAGVYILENTWNVLNICTIHAGSNTNFGSEKQRQYIRRLFPGKSREAVVIFLFCLEALFFRASRTQSSVDLSLQQTLADIGSYNDQTSFYFSCTVFLYNTLSEMSAQAVIPVIESKELANEGATRNTKQYIHSVGNLQLTFTVFQGRKSVQMSLKPGGIKY